MLFKSTFSFYSFPYDFFPDQQINFDYVFNIHVPGYFVFIFLLLSYRIFSVQFQIFQIRLFI